MEPTSTLTLGPLALSSSVLTSWLVSLLLAIGAAVCVRRRPRRGSRTQAALEAVLVVLEDAVASMLPEHVSLVFPFVATLWLFIGAANLIGLVPGLSSPTSDLSVTAALAFLVFLSVHWFGIRIDGVKAYLKHYVTPSPLLLPFHVISEISRTLAMAIRLFGNMMSLEMAAALVLLVAGLLVPVPLLLLHVVEAVIQAYLFGMLALVYIAGALEEQDSRRQKRLKGADT